MRLVGEEGLCRLLLMSSQRQSDRTWLMVIAGVVVIAWFGVIAWNRRAPKNSVDEEAIGAES